MEQNGRRGDERRGKWVRKNRGKRRNPACILLLPQLFRTTKFLCKSTNEKRKRGRGYWKKGTLKRKTNNKLQKQTFAYCS